MFFAKRIVPLVLAAALFAGCMPVNLPQSHLQYTPLAGGTPVKLSRKPSLAVLPLEQKAPMTIDRRSATMGGEFWTEIGYPDWGPAQDTFAVRFSKWLTQEMRESGYFSEVRAMSWKEYAQLEKKPDLVISGDIDEIVADNSLYTITVIPPISLFAFIGMPIGHYEHTVKMTLYAASGTRPDKKAYELPLTLTDPKSGSHTLYGNYPKCEAANVVTNECFAWVEMHTMFPKAYAQFRDGLAKELVSGGKLYPLIKGEAN